MADFVSRHLGGGYGSELDDGSDKQPPDPIAKERGGAEASFKKPPTLPSRSQISAIEIQERNRGWNLRGLNAYDRHKKYINDYVLFYGKKDQWLTQGQSKIVTDHDILKKQYRFIRTEEDDDESTWEKRLAKKYYDKLFKEYCLADMSRYKNGQVGLRWRTEKEVFAGKGQFICGNKACESKEDLKSYEVNFAYVEASVKKNALVKLRVCPPCAEKLNYKHNKRMRKEQKKLEKKRKKLKGEQEPEEKEEEEEEEQETETKEAKLEEERKAAKEAEARAWTYKPEVEKSKEEEFDEYFEGLFL